MKKIRVSLAVVAGSGLLTMAPHADAAEAATASAQGDEGITLEEVVVTARRRSESLEDVPQTVEAVTPQELQKLNLENLQDLTGVVPGLTLSFSNQGFASNDTLRGVTFAPSTGSQNTVAFYMNDIWVTNNFVTTSNFDVGQIEVLKGPQGTLRGEPAPSGSLTVTTHRPDLEQFGGNITVTGTQYGNTNENGAINLPILPGKLAVRLAGVADDDDLDGIKSINDSAEPYNHTYGGRASVRFEPIDSLEANVVYQHLFSHQQYYTQEEGPGSPGGTQTFPPTAGYFLGKATVAPNYNGPPLSPFDRRSVQTYPGEEYTTDDIVTATVDWHFAGQVLSYDGGYWKYVIFNGNPVDDAHVVPGVTAANPIPRQAFQLTVPNAFEQTHSDELRLASETPIFGFMDYTVGFFYRDTGDQVDVVNAGNFFSGSFGTPFAAPNPNLYNPQYTLDALILSPKQEQEYSEFANLTFHLPHDTEVAAGGRFIDYKLTGSSSGILLPNGTFDALPPGAGQTCASLGYTSTYPGTCNEPALVVLKGNLTALPFTPQDNKVNTAIYNVSLSHKFMPGLLGYINSGSSWRPPSIAVGINNAANDPELTKLLHVQPEKSYSFELGGKWVGFDNRARVNLAVYHQQFNGFIYYGLPVTYLSVTAAQTQASQFAFTTNPDAVVNGVDFDSAFQFTRQWSFALAASFSNGHLTGSSIPCSPPNGGTTVAAFPAGTHVFLCPSHASVSQTPNFNATAQSEYDMPVPMISGVDAFIRGLYTFYGRNPHSSPFYVTPSYGILNLYMGLHSPSGAWEGAVFARNLLDTQRILYIGSPATQLSGGVTTLFGTSGYFPVGNVNAPGITQRQEFGLTVSYAMGSR